MVKKLNNLKNNDLVFFSGDTQPSWVATDYNEKTKNCRLKILDSDLGYASGKYDIKQINKFGYTKRPVISDWRSELTPNHKRKLYKD